MSFFCVRIIRQFLFYWISFSLAGNIDSAYDREGLLANGITHIVHLETYFQPKVAFGSFFTFFFCWFVSVFAIFSLAHDQFIGEFDYLVCHLDDVGKGFSARDRASAPLHP
jgi:hypothetical protein